MLILLGVLASGVLAGMVHVVSGPDHLVAVAPLSVSDERAGWRAGFCWGVGHSGGVWVLAALGLALREALPVETLSHWSERIVGATLIAIGLWGLRRALGLRIHAHVHTHDGVRHAHIHAHHRDNDHSRSAAHDHRHAALAIGVLHGLAGTSHLLGVLPALALPTRAAAVVYLLAYGVGSIAAMTAFAAAVGRVAQQRTRIAALPAHRLLQVCSLAAIVVGVVWLSGVAG